MLLFMSGGGVMIQNYVTVHLLLHHSSRHHDLTEGGSDTKNEPRGQSNWKYEWVLPRSVCASGYVRV